MSHEDDYGFWDDDRSYSLTGRNARSQSHRGRQSELRQRKAIVSRSRVGTPSDRPSSALFWSRLGLIGLVGVLAVSIAVAVSSESSLSRVAAGNVSVTSAPAAAVAFVATLAASTTTTTAALAVPVVAVETTAQVVAVLPTRVNVAAAATPATKAVTSTTAKAKAACAKTYKIVALDYWILIAKKFNVAVKDLLAVNQAKTSTALFPGRTICLPANAVAPKATIPATTTTTKPAKAKTAAAAAPTTTVKSAASKPKTTQPAQPTQPTTPAPPPLRNYSATEVEQIIRDVWPDDLEEQALTIARRESNLVPTAHNSCCIGLFQIYWAANQRFLSTLGISSASNLYDPTTNANAAYAMYLRSGWGPWS